MFLLVLQDGLGPLRLRARSEVHFHTDLHPGNVILGDNGRLIVIDYGSTERRAAAARMQGTPESSQDVPSYEPF